jgi:glycosyltransferase involved in cell wall biosynthesis
MQYLQTEKLQPIQLPHLPDTPLVSVLIGNYNYARYIGETLESVLCQTYPHFEVLVCDDGSTDNSCEVIETYIQKDSRIQLISKQNGGISTALNAAYQKSKGDIVCILDADDLWMPDKLQKVVETFKSNSKCGFVIHNVIQIDAQGENIKSTPMMRQLASGWKAPNVLENGGFFDNIPPASALIIRKEVASLIFPVNEAIKRHVDGLIIALVLLLTEVRAVPEVLSKFRLHGSNITSLDFLTVERMERWLVTLKQIHQEQKQLLEKVYGTEIAERLSDLQFNMGACHDRYLLSRLKGGPKKERREVHKRLINHPNFNVLSVPQQWLFRLGEYLPNAIFKMFFHHVYGPSRLKRLVRWLIGLRHTVSPVRELS